MTRRILFILIMLALVASAFVFPASTSADEPVATASITVTKYAADGTTILAQVSKTIAEMESELPVQGDGTTHYWTQGPTFNPANLWDPAETLNLKDKGALQGTNIKDLCQLAGGASSGDTINLRANDGYNQNFAYDNVYNPAPAQGPMVLCWKKDGNYAGPVYSEAMQLVFFAQTANAFGQLVFGNQDMHDCLPQANWQYYWQNAIQYPSCNGLSIKWIDSIAIYSSEVASWDLALQGVSSYTMSKAEFENGVACTSGGHGAAWTDSATGDVWSGLPLWLLAGWVDDGVTHGAGAFNDALAAAGYQIRVSAADGYSYTFESAFAARNDNIIVANALNDGPLPEDKYPLRMVGSALTSGAQEVSEIVKIELLNLPVVQTWQLTLKGAVTYTMTQAEFDSAVNCLTNNHSASCTDGSGVWKGLPLWLLVGYVDDGNQHGPGAFNDALAAIGYDIKVTASDGYNYTFSSSAAARNNTIIVANTLNGSPLAPDKYPLKLVGDGLTSGKQKVSQIVSIELVNLPDEPTPPVPEMTPGVLLGMGLAAVAGGFLAASWRRKHAR